MLFHHKDSLRHSINKTLRKHHKELFSHNSCIFIKYVNFLSQKNKWWLVFAHVLLLLFVFAYVKIPYLSFVIFEGNTAAILIDQRTANVATIISMTLAVMGLVLGNLAVKDPQTYKLLFVNSRLFLIIYYILSVILCLIAISTLRESMDTDVFHQFVLAGTWLAITILIAIGFLFSTILNFADSASIQKKFEKLLYIEAKRNLEISLLTKISLQEFGQVMNEFQIKPYPKHAAVLPNVNPVPGDIVSPARLVYDIKLTKLRGILADTKTKSSPYYLSELSINNIVNIGSHLLFSNGIISLKVNKVIRAKSAAALLKLEQEYMKYFKGKLREYSAEGKADKVTEILAIYRELNLLQMKHA